MNRECSTTVAGRDCSRRAVAERRKAVPGTGTVGTAGPTASARGAGTAAWRTGCTSPAWAAPRSTGTAPRLARRTAPACLRTASLVSCTPYLKLKHIRQNR